MTSSALASRILTTSKYSSRGGAAISRVIVHHWAGLTGGIERLTQSKDAASANYLLLASGEIIASVPEEYRAWTSGSSTADNASITIEIQNSTLGPQWLVSQAAINALVKLIADIGRRYRWGSIDRTRVRGHREFASTSCPGPYLYPQLSTIAAKANRLLGGTPPAPPTPEPPVTSFYDRQIDGDPGPYTYEGMQRFLAARGYYDRVIDGEPGPYTWRGMQRYLQDLGLYKREIDGQPGPYTYKALQTHLRNLGFYSRVIDGQPGPYTWRGVQTWLSKASS